MWAPAQEGMKDKEQGLLRTMQAKKQVTKGTN